MISINIVLFFLLSTKQKNITSNYVVIKNDQKIYKYADNNESYTGEYFVDIKNKKMYAGNPETNFGERKEIISTKKTIKPNTYVQRGFKK